MADKKLHSTGEIKRIVRKAMNKDDISAGVFVGALRDLTAKEPIYTNPRRGYYQLSEKDTVLLITVEQILKNAKNDIENELNKNSGLKLYENIFNEVLEVQKVRSKLDEMIS